MLFTDDIVLMRNLPKELSADFKVPACTIEERNGHIRGWYAVYDIGWIIEENDLDG